METKDAQDLAAPDGEAERQWEHEWMQHHYRLALQSLRNNLEPVKVAVLEGLLAGRSAVDLAECLRLSETAVRRVRKALCDRLQSLIARQLFDEEAPDARPGSRS